MGGDFSLFLALRVIDQRPEYLSQVQQEMMYKLEGTLFIAIYIPDAFDVLTPTLSCRRALLKFFIEILYFIIMYEKRIMDYI